MKRTYFLDKIYNVNIREFDNIIKAIIENLNLEQYPYTYFKKGGKWLIEVERQHDLISILFDDYSMAVCNINSKTNASYSNNWQNIFNKFLHKNQKYYYKKSLQEIKNKALVISGEDIDKSVKL